MKGCDICSTKCLGTDGYDGSCCTIEERDFIIGPHSDPDEFIERLSNKLGREIKREDVFIEYGGGKDLFPKKTAWHKPSNFPALRVDVSNKRKPCIFYNTTVKSCMVYDIRPQTCRNYNCDYLKENC